MIQKDSGSSLKRKELSSSENIVSDSRRSKQENYVYSPLKDLKQDGIYHVYGVISSFKPPKRCTRGDRDFIMTLTLVDPSFLEGISINIFGESEIYLPPVKAVGDIFRAHRLKVNIFNGKPQGVGSNRSGFTFLLIGRADGVPVGISKTCTFTPNDRDRIKALKLWWEMINSDNNANGIMPALLNSSTHHSRTIDDKEDKDHNDRFTRDDISEQYNANDLADEVGDVVGDDHHPSRDRLPNRKENNKYLCTLDRLVCGTFCDIICKIVHIELVEHGVNRRVILKVWDGTGPNEKSSLNFGAFGSQSLSFSDTNSPPNRNLMSAVSRSLPLRSPASTVSSMDASSLPSSDPLASLFGSLVTVVIWRDDYFPMFIERKILPGQWILMKGMLPITYASALELKLSESAKMMLLDDKDPRVEDLLRAYERRCANYQLQRSSKKLMASVTLHDDIPFSSLTQVLSSKEVPNKFHCCARVVGYFPDFSLFTRPYCLKCDRCASFRTLKTMIPLSCEFCKEKITNFVYMFQLKLADETGLVDDDDKSHFHYTIADHFNNG